MKEMGSEQPKAEGFWLFLFVLMWLETALYPVLVS